MQDVRLFPRFSAPFLSFDAYDYRAMCLFFACLVYGLFGSPTPDHFGVIEIIVGALLALSIGIGRTYDAFIRPHQWRFWKSAGQVWLIYGMSVPLLVGALSGANSAILLRDIFPFLFLFLPLFMLPVIRAKPHYFRSTLVAVVLIGLLFALRSIVMRFGGACTFLCSGDLLYLENMPTVLFACLLLIGGAMRRMMRGFTLKNIAIFSLFIVLALVPIAAMALTQQRASLGAVVIYSALVFAHCIYLSPRKAFGIAVFGVIALSVINISFAAVFDPLLDKTHKVGLNMRPQEMAAVWDAITRDLLTFLFGLGWGGQFASPAVGGLTVNFTHNFFSSVLLKTGAIGLVMCLAYVGGLLERLCRVVLAHMVIGLALAAPILIDLTLYASFKSLDFGLMLLMISGALVYLRHSNQCV